MNQQSGPMQQMIDIQKAFVDGMVKNAISMWEHFGTLSERVTWLPEEGRKALKQWVDMNKKACEGLRIAIGNGYSNLQKVSGTMAKETESAISKAMARRSEGENAETPEAA